MMNYFSLSANEERLRKMGKSFSTQSRQCRAKRIDVNVKVNTIVFLVEVLGGVIIGFFTAIPHANYMYTATLIWYGNVIPSCYLINSSDIKEFIMKNGWHAGLSKIYTKKKSCAPPSKQSNYLPPNRRNINTSKRSNNTIVPIVANDISVHTSETNLGENTITTKPTGTTLSVYKDKGTRKNLDTNIDNSKHNISQIQNISKRKVNQGECVAESGTESKLNRGIILHQLDEQENISIHHINNKLLPPSKALTRPDGNKLIPKGGVNTHSVYFIKNRTHNLPKCLFDTKNVPELIPTKNVKQKLTHN